MWPSIWTWLGNNLLMLGGVIVSWPLLRLSAIHTGPLPPWYAIVGQLVFFWDGVFGTYARGDGEELAARRQRRPRQMPQRGTTGDS